MTLCDECNGACCRYLFLPYSVAAASFYKARGGRVVMVGARAYFAIPHICPLLSGGRCSQYASRPAACLDWQAGGAGCLACRKLEGFMTK